MIHIDNWNVAELASQCIMPRLNVQKFFAEKEYQKEICALVEAGIGGFCIFSGELENTRNAIDLLQNSSAIPLLFSADMEWGLTMRIQGGVPFPHAMALGKNTPDVTRAVAGAIAEEARQLGIYWNFAPVCDINSNPNNPIINIRAFGEDSSIVNEHSRAFIEGTQEKKVIACAKHFPGHGDTQIDSHLEMPTLAHNRTRLENVELIPFKNAIECGARSIMAAHIAVPAYHDTETPASLSERILSGLLREELKYNGIIVTDALDMKAITKRFDSGSVAVRAIEAGANIALLPEEPAIALKRLVECAESSSTLKEKLRTSSKRIIAEKRWCGLLPRQYSGFGSMNQHFTAHEKIALKAALNAVDVIGCESLLPVKDSQNIACFAILQREDDFNNASHFFNLLAQMFENNCDFGYVDLNITDEQISDFVKQTESADLILFPIFSTPRAFTGSLGASDKISHIIKALSCERSNVSILFGNPYLKNTITSDTIILVYSDSVPSLAAAALQFGERSLEEF